MEYRNAQSAFLAQAAEILSRGQMANVRGAVTRELRQVTITLLNPLERCIVIPGRNNNPFAAIYETLWVLSGRNDIGDLVSYLPRAADFSDDGKTWRAGYGPRLRAWHGVDQLTAVVDVLTQDRQSRRAVMSIFDPALDYQPSKDIPCTNWLQFTCRDDVLDLAITVRSNDLMWGFTGINTFEWSVLHEMMSFWTGAQAGSATYFIGSLHLYERHFGRVERMLGNALAEDPYLAGAAPQFMTPLVEFDAALNQWFELEAQARGGRSLDAEALAKVADPLLRDFLTMVNVYWAHQRGEGSHFDLVADLGLRAAGREFLSRDETLSSAPSIDVYLADFVVSLHRVKADAYGDSWKRRGELLSILPNVARKVDRLERLDLERGAPSVSFDTAVDLFVYAVKHRTFLADVESNPGLASWSDGVEGFERVARQYMTGDATIDIEAARSMVLGAYHHVEAQVVGGTNSAAERATAVEALASSAWILLATLARRNPWVVREAAAELVKFADWKD
ncbi:thymidylate synthase [Microbacterium invictum]|uniref:Thymidylate synthase n=1 Tax=Microbacterium invictum TaxID=515415 RepID=A0ABZ0VDQ0_9MICO|nr:thymidylate synthase [Microbacterium invictum]WQB71594.1 thymidylate synthase [Microbacterium invictum]